MFKSYNVNRSFGSRFRFRRWSRKAFATFRSIGLEVSIGHVAKSVSERLYLKQCPLEEAMQDTCTSGNADNKRQCDLWEKYDKELLDRCSILSSLILFDVEKRRKSNTNNDNESYREGSNTPLGGFFHISLK